MSYFAVEPTLSNPTLELGLASDAHCTKAPPIWAYGSSSMKTSSESPGRQPKRGRSPSPSADTVLVHHVHHARWPYMHGVTTRHGPSRATGLVQTKARARTCKSRRARSARGPRARASRGAACCRRRRRRRSAQPPAQSAPATAAARAPRA